ncbi:MAG TPA: DUF488 family protein, partial [Ilumatobacteraceae bacterium]|nr:DUF488 family protein [Ilumatobacteraceae bacterium]
MTPPAGTGDTVRLRRAYDPAGVGDGYRVLVDRLWPRGVRREALHLDEWCTNIAPSAELRAWFGHDAAKWTEFQTRYRRELDGNPDVARLAGIAAHATLTLVYGAHDTEHNQAVVIRD